MKTEKKTIIANWKTNPKTYSEAVTLAAGYPESSDSIDIVICPPPVFQMVPLLDTTARGAQDVHSEKNATGGWSAEQLSSIGVTHCIVGHSERRALGETNQSVNEKIRLLLAHSIVPIVCVGELERDDTMEYIQFLINQIHETFSGISRTELESVIVAYEPVWAIGATSTRPCSAQECREIILLIQRELIQITGNLPIGKITTVYGGSVNAENAREYITVGGCDGLLIGRASLDATTMNSLVQNSITYP